MFFRNRVQRYDFILELLFESYIFSSFFSKLCNSEYVFVNNEKFICVCPSAGSNVFLTWVNISAICSLSMSLRTIPARWSA